VPLPDLETQAADALAVLDHVGSEAAVLVAGSLSIAPLIMLALAHPDRVSGLIWNNPTAKGAWAADYPWGDTDDDYRARLAVAEERWGTIAHGREVANYRVAQRLDLVADRADVEHEPRAVNRYGRVIRNSASPDLARDLEGSWHDTDIRALLPLVQAPAHLLTGTLDAVDETRYIASLMPNAVVHVVDGRSGIDYEAFERVLRAIIRKAPADVPQSVLKAVLFTDLVGSTVRHAELGDRGWKGVIEQHHALVRDSLERYRGVEQDTAGDGFFATFDGPAAAIRCADEVIGAVEDLGLQMRAGVHVGECELIDGKISGLTVTIAARIAALAGGGQLLVSQTVRDLVAGSGFRYDEGQQRELKGVPGTWQLWSVGGPSPD
jgi:class 3 adenylate cyclase